MVSCNGTIESFNLIKLNARAGQKLLRLTAKLATKQYSRLNWIWERAATHVFKSNERAFYISESVLQKK